MSELQRLRRRTKELVEEIKEQKGLHRQARLHHVRLLKEQREMDARIQGERPGSSWAQGPGPGGTSRPCVCVCQCWRSSATRT